LRIPRSGFRSTRRGVVRALLADGATPAVVQRDAVAVSVFMVALTTGRLDFFGSVAVPESRASSLRASEAMVFLAERSARLGISAS
jgi:hypothetical protein